MEQVPGPSPAPVGAVPRVGPGQVVGPGQQGQARVQQRGRGGKVEGHRQQVVRDHQVAVGEQRPQPGGDGGAQALEGGCIEITLGQRAGDSLHARMPGIQLGHDLSFAAPGDQADQVAPRSKQAGVDADDRLDSSRDGRRRVVDQGQTRFQAGSSNRRPAGARSTVTFIPLRRRVIVKSRTPSPALIPSTRSRS